MGFHPHNAKDLNESENRNVIVNVGSWADSGALYNCDAWTPDPSTVPLGQQFLQTRNCSQDQTATATYSVSGSQIDSKTLNQTISKQEQNIGTGTYIEITCQPFTSQLYGWEILVPGSQNTIGYYVSWGGQFNLYGGYTSTLPTSYETRVNMGGGYSYWADTSSVSGESYGICRVKNECHDCDQG